MNGFIKRTVAGLCLGTGLSVLAGCVHYRQLVDPCWPERWNNIARSSVREIYNAQAYNGHIIDQTIWDYCFNRDKEGKPGDVLNEAGQARLDYLARRRPVPDSHLYLQTAQAIPYTPTAPEKTITARQELDQKRIQAIQAYLSTKLGPNGVNLPVEVTVFDPAPVGIDARGIGGTAQQNRDVIIIGVQDKLNANFQAVMPALGGLSVGSGGGSGGGGGSTGGGGGGGAPGR